MHSNKMFQIYMLTVQCDVVLLMHYMVHTNILHLNYKKKMCAI